MRLAAAIKGFTVDGQSYQPGDVEIEGTIYFHDPLLYPGNPLEAPACGFFLGSPRIRDNLAIRGVDSQAGPSVINGFPIVVWTASYFGESQPEPASVVIEDLGFENTGPAVQTGNGSFADVTLRNLSVHATMLAPAAPTGCPANAFQYVFHHRGSLRMENVVATSNIDSGVPVPGPGTGCPFPGTARAIGVAVALARDLEVVIRESAFGLYDLEGAPLDDSVGVFALSNAGTPITIEETWIDADRGVWDFLQDGLLRISESTIVNSTTGISVDAISSLFTGQNELHLSGGGVGIQIGSLTGPSTLEMDVLTGEAAVGVRVSGSGHEVVETDLLGLDAGIGVELTGNSQNCSVRDVDGVVVDNGTDNTIEGQ